MILTLPRATAIADFVECPNIHRTQRQTMGRSLSLSVTAFPYCLTVKVESFLLGFAMRAIETTGILNTQGQIQLDHPILQEKAKFVRVILLIPEDESNEQTWSNAVSNNPSFAFLHDPEEDLYTLEDGQPVSNEGLNCFNPISF